MRCTTEACAKINWALDILGVRGDGYHELDMLMQSIELHDTLSFEEADELELTSEGLSVDCGTDNLILRAANALNRYAGVERGARIHLVKRIPLRAGLGGGSSDCASALLALNELWGLRLSLGELMELAETLGSDIAFCLRGGYLHVGGAGERLTALEKAPELYLLLLCPPSDTTTGQVYHAWDMQAQSEAQSDMPGLIKALASGRMARAQRCSKNALEAPAVRLTPAIGEALERLRALKAPFVRMTGSGSAVFAAFRDEKSAQAAARALPDAIVTRTLTRSPNERWLRELS